MDGKEKQTLKLWLITIAIFVISITSYLAGVYSASTPYYDRYPVEYSWWIDHERLHYPGVTISMALENTSCKQSGNIYPPNGDNITQIQWLGGWDGGFVANIKVKYDTLEYIVPTPDVGYCIYIYDAPQNITVYGQDSASGGWIKLGSGNSSR